MLAHEITPDKFSQEALPAPDIRSAKSNFISQKQVRFNMMVFPVF